MTATWNDTYLIFNDSIIQESAGSPRWTTIRVRSEIDEVRKKMRSIPLWFLDLSNLLISPTQYDELQAFQYQVQGMLNPFLVRNARNCRFENAAGNGSTIGVGDGAHNTYQLVKVHAVQGRTFSETIRFPNYNYPPLYNINAQPWEVLPPFTITVNGVDVTGTTTVDRDNGLIHLATNAPSGHAVVAYGGFYTLMICSQDEIPVKPEAAMYRIARGISLEEPTRSAL